MEHKVKDYSILGLSLGMILGPLVVIILHYQGIKSPLKNDTMTLFLSTLVFSILGLLIGLSIKKEVTTDD